MEGWGFLLISHLKKILLEHSGETHLEMTSGDISKVHSAKIIFDNLRTWQNVFIVCALVLSGTP